MKLLILLLLMLSGVSVHASVDLVVGGWSKHYTGKEYNETHRMIGFEYDDIQVVNFTNSYDDNSTLLAYTPELGNLLPFIPAMDGKLLYGYTAGLVTGYGDIMPVLIPRVSYETRYISVDINIVPTKVAAVSLRIRF